MGCELRPSGFVRDLCVTLAHRWDPERIFVILTAYFDESGTHGDSPATVVAGLVGSTRQWAGFEAGVNRLKGKYGFQEFHTKKFKKNQGDFKGWDDPKKTAFLADLTALVATGLAGGATSTLSNSRFYDEYRQPNVPSKGQFDSKYGLCFRLCLLHLLEVAALRARRNKPCQLHVVIESGHANWGGAQDIFQEMKRTIAKAHPKVVLATFSLADKDECDPLLIADYVAHVAFLRAVTVHEGKQPEARKSTPGNTQITHLEFPPGGLVELREKVLARERVAKLNLLPSPKDESRP
jgi:hypothetical protein